MSRRSLTLETYRELLGQEIGKSEWLLIDQARINAFADATLDHQYIHTDPERARASVFGGTVAHGFLILSLLSYFADAATPELLGKVAAVNYGCERLRFITPVKCGDRIRGCFKLVEIREKAPRQIILCLEVSMEIEGEARPALVAQWLVLHMME
jgi:acyl dehydratase